MLTDLQISDAINSGLVAPALSSFGDCSTPFATVSRSPSSARRSSPIRVLHVINGEHYAGAERVQDQLALRLPHWGYEAAFACVKPARFPELRVAQSAALFKFPMRSRFDLRPATRLARLVRSEQYALIHTHSPRAAMVGCIAARLARVPMVHHMHGQTSTEVGRRWLSRFSAAIERATVCRAATIAVSASLYRHLRATGYGKRPVHLVPNGVPIRGELTPPASERDVWTIGTVAMFRPRKGIEVLLEAVADLRKRGCPVRLRAVGGFETPTYECEAKQFADRLGLGEAVEWTGFRRDVNAELAAMDIFVLPSLISEGMPLAVLEAMAAGVPVIGTRVDGITDVVCDGVDGLLVTPGDRRELADAIEKVVRRDVDWPAIRAAAHRRQAKEFSDHSMAAGVAAVYDKWISK